MGCCPEPSLCSLEIPNTILLAAKGDGADIIEEVNKCIEGNAIFIDVDCVRLRTGLQISSGKLAMRMRKAKGLTEHRKIQQGVTSVVVNVGETVSIGDLQAKLEMVEVKVS